MENQADWYAIRTLTGNEVAGQDELSGIGVEAWCPMQSTMTKPMKKRKAQKVSRPLLPGYVLARVTPDQWEAILGCKAVIGWVANERGPLPCKRPAEVSTLMERERLGEFEHDGIEGRLSKGDLLEVLFGPFTGWSVSFIGVIDHDIEAEVEWLGAPRKIKLSAQQVRLSG